MKENIFRICLIIAVVLQACGDEHQFRPDVQLALEESPKLKFFHGASDTVGVNLFLDDEKITGGSASTITTFGSANLGKVNIGTVTFSNSFPVTNYTTAPKDAGTFTVVFPQSFNATTTFNQKTMSTTESPVLEPYKHYTVAFLGVSPNYETVVFEDDMDQLLLDGSVYIRIANFIHNSTDKITVRGTPPATTLDPNPTPVTFATALGYKEMTAFNWLPVPGSYTNFQILNANTGSVLATLAAPNNNFAPNKVYTIVARGRIGAVGAGAPTITRMINR